MLKRVILTRFLKNKLAAIGFCLLIIFVLAAIFAPFLSGYGERYDRFNEYRKSTKFKTFIWNR